MEGGKKVDKSWIWMRAQALTWRFLSRTLFAACWNLICCQGGDHMTHKRMTSAWSSMGDDPEVLQMHRASIHHICRDAVRTWATGWPLCRLQVTCPVTDAQPLPDTHFNFILIKTQKKKTASNHICGRIREQSGLISSGCYYTIMKKLIHNCVVTIILLSCHYNEQTDLTVSWRCGPSCLT